MPSGVANDNLPRVVFRSFLISDFHLISKREYKLGGNTVNESSLVCQDKEAIFLFFKHKGQRYRLSLGRINFRGVCAR